MAAGMDVDVADGVVIPRTYGFARRAKWILGDVVPLLILSVKVLSWNVSGDLFLFLFLSRTSMLTTWMLKSGVIGSHELFTPEALCCLSLNRNNGMTAGQKLLETEQMDCRGAGLVQTTSLVPLAVVALMATMASIAPMASMATMVLEAVAALLTPKLNVGIPQPRLQLAATPRESDGSRSLRRVDRIGGMRAEGSCKIDGERGDGLFYKIVQERADLLPYKNVGKIAAGITRKESVMNELMGSAANEVFERRITASWCGSRVAGWRIAVVKTSASVVDIASFASMASLVSLDTKWNVLVPRMKMMTTHRQRGNQCDAVIAVLASMALLAPMASRASMAPMVWMASMASTASMASMVMASMASMASMVWVTALRWRIEK